VIIKLIVTFIPAKVWISSKAWTKDPGHHSVLWDTSGHCWMWL